MSDYTSPQILGAISAAITAKDAPAIVELLHMLAVVDPHAAEDIQAAIRLTGLIK